MANLFVYGTLLPSIHELARKHGRQVNSHPLENRYEWAILKGYARIWPKEMAYPFMIKAEGHEMDGVVYYDVSESQLASIDWFEDCPDYYRRIKVRVVTLSGKVVDAYAYIGEEVARKQKWTWADELPRIRQG